MLAIIDALKPLLPKNLDPNHIQEITLEKFKRIGERVEWRVSPKDGKLKAVVLRRRDKGRNSRYIGKRHPDFPIYERAYEESKRRE